MSMNATPADFVTVNISPSDYDIGLAALTDALVNNLDQVADGDQESRSDIKEFIEETQRTEEKSQRLLKTEMSYHKWSRISLWSAGAGGVCYYGSRVPEYFLSIFYPEAEIVTSTVVMAAETLVFLGIVAGGITAFKERRLKAERKGLNLSPDESASLRKFQSVITNIGSLIKANRPEESSVDMGRIATDCFKEIAELPKRIKDHPLPSTNQLASLVISQLPDENPLKAVVNTIVAMELSSSPPEGSFVNKGQESKPNLESSFRAPEPNIVEYWERLNAMIPHLSLNKLYVSGHDRAVRVIHRPS